MLIVKNTQEELARARVSATAKAGPFRAPHHTVSLTGLMSELAIAAGGVLWLDEADSFRGADLLAFCNTWAFMHPAYRPVVYFAISADVLPGSATAERFETRVKEASALSARQWTNLKS